MPRGVIAMDEKKMAFTGVLPVFEKLLVSRDTHNNHVEFYVHLILGNGLREAKFSPPPPSIPTKDKR